MYFFFCLFDQYAQIKVLKNWRVFCASSLNSKKYIPPDTNLPKLVHTNRHCKCCNRSYINPSSVLHKRPFNFQTVMSSSELCGMTARAVWFSPLWLVIWLSFSKHSQIITIRSCFSPWCRIDDRMTFVFAHARSVFHHTTVIWPSLYFSTVTDEFMLPTPTTTHLLQQPHTALVPW